MMNRGLSIVNNQLSIVNINGMLSPHLVNPLLQSDHNRIQTEFVSRFYQLLTHTIRPPAAISIDGLWGTGKTTVMRSLQEQLHTQGYPVFWFNPWKFRQTDNVVLAFLQTLYLSAADFPCFPDICAHGATILQLLIEAGLDAGLRVFAQGKPMNTAFGVPFSARASSATSLSFGDYLKAHRTIEQEFVELLVLISRHYADKPVVIFVDDLDRCVPGDVIHFLQALKHVFLTHGSQAICICGIDTKIACQYLLDAYPQKGSEFARKVFQQIFPLTLSMPYSANIQEVIVQYIRGTYPDDMPVRQQADILATMIYTRGLQSNISGVRKFLNIAANFGEFLGSLPQYRWQQENDFILNLLVIKEAWPDLYQRLLDESMTHGLTMCQLIQHMAEHHRLQAPQEKFLTAYVGHHTAFACEYLAVWLTYHPMLNALAA